MYRDELGHSTFKFEDARLVEWHQEPISTKSTKGKPQIDARQFEQPQARWQWVFVGKIPPTGGSLKVRPHQGMKWVVTWRPDDKPQMSYAAPVSQDGTITLTPEDLKGYEAHVWVWTNVVY